MNFKSLKSNKGKEIIGPILIHPNLFHDSRGYFFESWNQNSFDNIVETSITLKKKLIRLNKEINKIIKLIYKCLKKGYYKY